VGAIERLLVTYLLNALWMTVLIALAAGFAGRLLHESPFAHRNRLWVLALTFASLSPISALRDPRNEAPANAGVGPAPLGGTRDLPMSPPMIEVAAVLYLALVGHRGLVLYRACRRARRTATAALPAPLTPQQRQIADRIGLGARGVCIATASQVSGPVVFGVWNPVLILPEWFVATSSVEEFTSTLSHELAHVRRHDFPAARWIKSQIERSRELACDELAAPQLPNRRAYARCLLSIARSVAAPASSPCAVGMFESSSLEERIVSLLRGEGRRDDRWKHARAAAATSLLAASCVLGSAFPVQIARAPTPPQSEDPPRCTDGGIQQLPQTGGDRFLERATSPPR
jgi:beta-lactamase regulating signal transducer with metallopeptidase domain